MMQKSRFIGMLLLLFLYQFSANANQKLTIEIGNIWFKQWLGQDLNLTFNLGTENITIEGRVGQLNLPDPINEIKDIHFKCAKFEIDPAFVNCSDGRLSISSNKMKNKDISFSFYQNGTENITRIKLNYLMAGEGIISLAAELEQDAWTLSVDAEQADISMLIELFHPYIPAENLIQLSAWELDGQINFTVNMIGKKEQLLQIEIALNSADFNVSNDSGQYVAEQLDFELTSKFVRQNDLWQWQHDLQLDNGQSYVEPIFIDFLDNSIAFSAAGDWQTDKQYLNVDSFQINQKDVGEGFGYYSGTMTKAEKMGFMFTDLSLDTLYPIWLQPTLMQTAAARVETSGTISLQYEQIDNEYQLKSRFSGVSIEDEENKFGVVDLAGTFSWTNCPRPIENSFGWRAAHLYGLPIGGTVVNSQVASSRLTLHQSLRLPILDGQLQINNFALQHVEGEGNHINWTFDGLLSPVSMEKMSQSLGWPALHGKISGVIPEVRYKQKQVTMDGALMVKLFNGTTIIRDLKLDDPLGILPRLYANVDVTGIDLDIVTRTFDFGKITGSLDGHINNLSLVGWQAVEFDAHFATPEGDHSRRRISQKAVDNLAQVGGGASGALSTSFLRFFEDFSYRKIGLSCYLHNDVCHMSGVEDAAEGYYIVKGGGLPPRINVLGYTRQVDWPELVERLQAVSKSSGPVIQ